MGKEITKLFLPESKKWLQIEGDIRDPLVFSERFVPLVNSLDEKVIEISLKDIPFPILMRVKTSDVPTFEEIFVNGEYDFDIPFEINTIIDAGANVGYSAILFAQKYPKAKIISIEPEDSNFKILKENTVKYPQITVIKAGLWGKKEFLKVSNPDITYHKWGVRVEKGDQQKGIESITIPEIMKILGTETIDLLKLDIEGSEKEVFEHNPDEWLPKSKFLIVELHEKMRAGATQAYYSAIKNYDFKETKFSGKYAEDIRHLTNKSYLV